MWTALILCNFLKQAIKVNLKVTDLWIVSWMWSLPQHSANGQFWISKTNWKVSLNVANIYAFKFILLIFRKKMSKMETPSAFTCKQFRQGQRCNCIDHLYTSSPKRIVQLSFVLLMVSFFCINLLPLFEFSGFNSYFRDEFFLKTMSRTVRAWYKIVIMLKQQAMEMNMKPIRCEYDGARRMEKASKMIKTV